MPSTPPIPPELSADRQPVHTVYGGAHLFRADIAARLGERALAALADYAPQPGIFAQAVGLPPELSATVYERLIEKLRREPVEDFRCDFEDGYGYRPESEEDGHARAAAAEVARGMELASLPPFLGLRIKPLSPEVLPRGLRTLEIFFKELAERTGGSLPPHFVVTLPKVTRTDEVEALADALDLLEEALGSGPLGLELMIETPQAILDAQGMVPLRRLVQAGRGRCVAVHFGAYDYTAALGITAHHQRLDHPACGFARQTMLAALAGSGVYLADGAVTLLPIPPHRPAADGAALSPAELEANRAAVHAAWRLHYREVQRSLAEGFPQSWDLHPAQLPSRYAAVYAFLLEGLDRAAARLRNFVDRAAQATRVGAHFDDAATGQGLLNTFRRALACGALSEAEVVAQTGLGREELRSPTFEALLAERAKRGGQKA
ncbi:MAG TPA: aldolase/citrate lyase family protein [Thermoanaerobaculia bacterium]|nr:aldolase/citrate lyase family protein [Thermoanaerobaculia bacterium]